MKAVDTNVLLRIALGDDRRQTTAAEAFVTGGAWVSLLVLAEAVWVLRTRYRRSAQDLATAVTMFAERTDLVLESPAVVESALALFRRWPQLGFTDCLVLEQARAAGHQPLGTFDLALSHAPGAVLL